MELYNYQRELISRVQLAWRRGKRKPCIVLPCGGGKSVICADMAKRTTDNRHNVLFLVHRQELCQQIADTFRSYGVNMQRCQIGMVQTITRHIDRVNKPSLIITDENHHCVAGSYKKIYEAFPKSYFVGVTATPVRLNGGGLGEINDCLITGPSVKWLIENNRLSPFDYYAPSVSDLSGIRSRGGDYAAEDIEIKACSLKVVGSIPDDAVCLYEVTNNANDTSPVWEDCTEKVKSGLGYLFGNKTAENGFAFNFRVTIQRGTSNTGGFITQISGGFE